MQFRKVDQLARRTELRLIGNAGDLYGLRLSWTIAQLISLPAILTDKRREGVLFSVMLL